MKNKTGLVFLHLWVALLLFLRTPEGTSFVVLEGASEVLGRLLHARDGLALWNAPIIDVEAFTNDAILLLIRFN